jgi:hypothetical protein
MNVTWMKYSNSFNEQTKASDETIHIAADAKMKIVVTKEIIIMIIIRAYNENDNTR